MFSLQCVLTRKCTGFGRSTRLPNATCTSVDFRGGDSTRVRLGYFLVFYPDKTHLAASTATKGADTIPRIGMHLWLKKAHR